MRTWKRSGKILHHLIDPRTGEPAKNGVVSVSVLAPSAAQADVFAKTALIMGLEDGARFLESQHTPGMFVFFRQIKRHDVALARRAARRNVSQRSA